MSTNEKLGARLSPEELRELRDGEPFHRHSDSTRDGCDDRSEKNLAAAIDELLARREAGSIASGPGEPESMSVGELNATVRALREELHLQRLRAQAAEDQLVARREADEAIREALKPRGAGRDAARAQGGLYRRQAGRGVAMTAPPPAEIRAAVKGHRALYEAGIFDTTPSALNVILAAAEAHADVLERGAAVQPTAEEVAHVVGQLVCDDLPSNMGQGFHATYAREIAIAIRQRDEEHAARGLAEVERLKQEVAALQKGLDFRPLGDNHHNAALCPYCSPTPHAEVERLRAALERFMADHIREKSRNGWPREACRCILCVDARAAGAIDAAALAVLDPAPSPAPAQPDPHEAHRAQGNASPLDWGGLCKKCGRNSEPVPEEIRNEARLAGHKWWCSACGYPVGCHYFEERNAPPKEAQPATVVYRCPLGAGPHLAGCTAQEPWPPACAVCGGVGWVEVEGVLAYCGACDGRGRASDKRSNRQPPVATVTPCHGECGEPELDAEGICHRTHPLPKTTQERCGRCGNTGSHGESGKSYCSACGGELLTEVRRG